ncbi:peptidoglycan-binding protein [Bariatricus massiliensis]|uniref:Peptidoglycan-binding protein n=1 Tax=Bariatricus massiliensis TaxID=1745713 RepID=A0ABS8DCV0_9FIRM|nr:peptidoglycan-binding protein [Bariatricus massiliensis]MCB7303430.1 peptidoglycan-binding protein [Bariatricus massiliensis]MCB7373562.1 peptidoglycan-binding protein [Bariatricus massiliensis]MCB7386232.1 peptidoglycan-binding protein [Bariatricus massiliensis]MCB7410394.1 peptidoglycan-binding protein [Bariatricus massiliensis]MCQ5252322.1 peptidoglycan-binding protein [Bariatricus massiliensis]
MSILKSMQDTLTYRGRLQINVTSEITARPVPDATVQISYTGVPDSTLEEVTTDTSGQSETLELAAPPLEYSLNPQIEEQPYSEYTLDITAPGYEPMSIAGAEILPDVTAIQNVQLRPLADNEAENVFVIPAHTLYAEYPPKIPEDEIKPMNETGEIVLSRVVVPEYIVVHDGSPRDTTAQNYYVRYKDYIKNVASSEIYATWTENTIRANVLAIMSFTLNRVYTEWYRNQGYDFTITSSTAFDHKWIPERNIFDTISVIVDELFANYLSRPNVRQPILTQYCDGRRVQCPNWMTQWGSQALGEQGYSAIDILRYYYGDDMYINIAPEISGIPSSWPGYTLSQGSSGDKVRQMQEQLNVIAGAYPAIPTVTVDGIYGPGTAAAVTKFQSVFGLPQTGTVDYRTWYKISEIYVGVSRIAELT